MDNEIFQQTWRLFLNNWRPGELVRLVGVHASNFEPGPAQMDLLESGRQQRLRQAIEAADHLRDKFGEAAIGLATGLKGGFRERAHENPVGLPGKSPRPKREGDS
jgi:DNA polymerase-4